MSNILSVHFQKLLAASFPTSLLPPPPARNGVAREAGFSFPGGGGGSIEPSGRTPLPQKGAQLTGPPKYPKTNSWTSVDNQQCHGPALGQGRLQLISSRMLLHPISPDT